MELMHAAASFLETYAVEVAGLGLGTVAASFGITGVATYVLVQMPEDELNEPASLPSGHDGHDQPRWTRVAAKYGRNILGVALIATGAVLAVPSIPPGKSLMVIGLIVLDFAGKRRLERRLLGGPRVLGTVNRLRARFGSPPLRIDRATAQ